MSEKKDIYAAMKRERAYQDRKWGSLEDHPHTVAEWIVVMEGELAEAKHEWLKNGDNEALKEVLQVMATGMACLEQHGITERDSCSIFTSIEEELK